RLGAGYVSPPFCLLVALPSLDGVDEQAAEGAVVGHDLIGVTRGNELADGLRGGECDGARRPGTRYVKQRAAETRIQDSTHMFGSRLAHVFAEAAQGKRFGAELDIRCIWIGCISRYEVAF